MGEARDCQEVRALIPELAAGVASGEERAHALEHVAGCADCHRALEDVAGTVDALLLLAPEHEPPPGFDERVLAAIKEPPARRNARTSLLAAAAAVLVAALAAGLTWWSTADDRSVADQYHQVLTTADGSAMVAADLEVDGATAGDVFGYDGDPSWLFVTVAGAESGSYHVRLVTDAGQRVWIGRCEVRGGSGSWGTTVDVPIPTVDRVEMYGTGLPTLVATFDS